MKVLSQPTMARDLRRAILIGTFIGVVLGILVILTLESDFVQQKFTSLRYRVIEALPQPDEPQFVPTALAIATESAIATPSPTSDPTTQPPNHPTSTRVPTRAMNTNVTPIQPSVALHSIKPDYQKWNNCGPTTLGMALQYFGKSDTQAQIAAFTKPNPDDRNVRPDELAAYADSIGLNTLIRVDGSIDRLKLILSNGLPVIVETAFVKQPQGWMGHYRLLNGYDDTRREFNTMDSYDGPNVKISFDDLDNEWRAFNRVYLVIYSDQQATLVRSMLGDVLNDQAMYTQAVAHAREQIAANPKDAFAQFNLGSSLVGLKRYADAAAAFDKARALNLPWRMMWYQFDPYVAYLQVGRNDEVIALADSLLRTTDDLEESHYYKGLALRALGRAADAFAEFQAALKWNKNYQAAQDAMANDK